MMRSTTFAARRGCCLKRRFNVYIHSTNGTSNPFTHQLPTPNSKDEKFLTLSFTALRIKKQQHSNFFLINHVLLA
jgi:hypothetical protein